MCPRGIRRGVRPSVCKGLQAPNQGGQAMRLRMFGALLLVLAMSATSAWAQAKVPGVTDTEVVIGATTPLSGPAAAWGTTALGAEAWAKYVNEQGGVHGRES